MIVSLTPISNPRREPGLHASNPEVLRRLAPKVRLWVFRYLGPSADVDDVTQEALIEIARALERFEGRSKIETYARRIAVRVAYRMRRRSRVTETLELVPTEADRRDPERLAMHRESLRRLYAALADLTEKRRTAFVLCAIEKLSHAEAAEVTGVSLDTLRARLKRARAQLTGWLATDPYFAPFFGAAGGTDE